jgi:IBR domain, a half RING-finger domain
MAASSESPALSAQSLEQLSGSLSKMDRSALTMSRRQQVKVELGSIIEFRENIEKVLAVTNDPDTMLTLTALRNKIDDMMPQYRELLKTTSNLEELNAMFGVSVQRRSAARERWRKAATVTQASAKFSSQSDLAATLRAEALRKMEQRHENDEFVREDDDDNDAGEKADESVGECQICFDEHPQRSFVSVAGCNDPAHKMCQPCMVEALGACIREARVVDMRCPGHQCDVIIDSADVQRLLGAKGDELYAKYLDFTLLQFMRAEKGALWCPTPTCGNALLLDDDFDESLITCSHCGARICVNCKRLGHGELNCMEAREGTGTASASSSATAANDVEDPDVAFQRYMQENNDVKPCGNCQWPTTKSSGCRHMTCSSCKAGMC